MKLSFLFKNIDDALYIIVSFLFILYFAIYAESIADSISTYIVTITVITISCIAGRGTKIGNMLVMVLSISLSLFITLELAVKRLSSVYFHVIPIEVINIFLDTNTDEVKSNIYFDKAEILGILISVISFFLFIRILINKKIKKISIYSVVAAFFVALSFYVFPPLENAISEIYKYKGELKYHAKVLREKNDFKWLSSSTYNGKETVVIFLGETHRGDYLGINGYSKETTPLLRQHGVISYDNAISQGAYTLQSTPMILSRKNVNIKDFFNEKSIISAYKEAGFKTWYVSQASKTHMGDSELSIIANEADVYIQASVDNDVFSKILSDKEEKKLIVYKTIGSHYLYHERYPSEYDVFKPSFNKNNYHTPTINDRELLENSYSNSILFSLDKQVSDFINILKNEDGIAHLSFISDHGTAIYEDGESLYGGNTKANFNIAMFFWFNDRYASTHSEYIKNLNNNKHKKITAECFADTELNLSHIYTDKKKGCTLIDDNISEKQRLIYNYNRIQDYDVDIKL